MIYVMNVVKCFLYNPIPENLKNHLQYTELYVLMTSYFLLHSRPTKYYVLANYMNIDKYWKRSHHKLPLVLAIETMFDLGPVQFLGPSLQDETLQTESKERNIGANMEFMNSVYYPVKVWLEKGK